MTQRDKWAKRDCVARYWAFKDEVRLRGVTVNNGDTIIFHIPMPKSWSKKKRQEHDGQYHQAKPDLDNLQKALLDAIYDDDAHIAHTTVIKLWSNEPGISITSQ